MFSTGKILTIILIFHSIMILSRLHIMELLLFGSNANNLAQCGVAYSNSNGTVSFSGTTLGARLALKSRELAIYCGRQFLPLWTALYVKPAPDDAVQAYEDNHR